MAITSVEESWDREGTQNPQWQRTYRRKFIVVTDGPYNGPIAVRAALPVQIGFPYTFFHGSTRLEFDFSSFVNSIVCRCVSKDGSQWECTADYAPYNPQIFGINPLTHPIKISWGTTKFERVCQYDINGDAITNSAGQYFDPPVTCDDSRMNLRIERNEPSFDPSIADTYKDSISSDVFFGQQPGTWKIADITADLEYNVDCGTPDGFYYKVTYTFEFRSEGWASMILDQGLMVLNGSDQLVQALDNSSPPVAVTSPIPLDGNGKALASSADLVFQTFDIYEEIAFGPLNLDPAGAPGQG